MSSCAVPQRPLFFAIPIATGLISFAISRGLPRPSSASDPAKSPTITSLGSQRKALAMNYWDRIAGATRLEALTDLWDELNHAQTDQPLLSLFRQQLLQRMVTIDATGGWAWAKASENGEDYLQTWAGMDRDDAAATLLTESKDANYWFRYVAESCANADPLRYLTEGLPASWGISESQHEDLRIKALAALIPKDFTKALSLAATSLTDGNRTHQELLEKFTAHVVKERGASGAVAWARSLHNFPESLREKMETMAVGELALESPSAAAAAFLELGNDRDKNIAGRIAALLAKQDPNAAMSWARKIQGSYSGSSAMAKLAEVIGPDAPALLAIANAVVIDETNPSEFDAHTFMSGMSALGNQELARLTSELIAQPSSPNQPALVAACIAKWSQKDAAAAYQMMLNLPPAMASAARIALVRDVGFGKTTGLPIPEQINLIEQIEANPSKDDWLVKSAIQAMWANIALADPAAALGSVRANSKFGLESVTDIFSNLSKQDPASSSLQLFELPPHQQQAAAEGFINGWSTYDPMSASVWTEALSTGPVRDAAATGLARALQSSEPTSAFVWAASISQPEQRLDLLKDILTTWPDKAAARETLESSSLAESVKATCREILLKATP